MRILFSIIAALVLIAGGCRPAEPAPQADARHDAPAGAPVAAPPAEAAAPVNEAPVNEASVNETPAAPRTAVLDRVVLVGASATSGFGVVVDDGRSPGKSAMTNLGKVFASALNVAPAPEVINRGHMMLFNAPLDIGPPLIDETLASDPTLVIAVDFLFWFGYGQFDRDRLPITDEMDRVGLLEEGLALLDRVKCPLVIGNLPDMEPAIGLMLSAAQVPEPDTLDLLNARLEAWAADRSNVAVLPFAALVAAMRSNESFSAGHSTWPAGSEPILVQRDRLHPTLHGLVAIVQMVVHELLRAFPALEATDFELDPESVIGRLRENL